MPLSRTQRQQRTRPARPSVHTPGVDAYGALRTGDLDFQARLVEYAPGRIAAFRSGDLENPVLFELEGAYSIKGRLMQAITADGAPLSFQKDCGCGGRQPPADLRGGRNALLATGGLTLQSTPEQPEETP